MEGNREHRSPSITLIIILALLLGLTGGILGNFLTSALRDKTAGSAEVAEVGLAERERTAAAGVPNSFADVAARVVPSVVNINVVSEVSKKDREEILRQMPFLPLPVPREREGLGSGVIIQPDGVVLTNEHVVKDARKIKVTLSDGREFTARVLGRDQKLDVAVLKIDASDLPAARLGDSSRLRPGDWALAIGNPLGLSSSVSLGVVSALNRPIYVSDRPYADLIQTDVSISPGNSGGPLVNSAGEVVGINTAIQIDAGQPIIGAVATRVGFAVPINSIKQILEELITTGKVVRPWVGVLMRMITEEDVKRWKLPEEKGVIIEGVMKDSPAKNAGLFPGDIVLKVDGKPVSRAEDVQEQVLSHKVGEVVVFEVKRESAGGYWRTHKVKIKTAEMPEDTSSPEVWED
jgi:serine protease Do